MRVGTRIRVPGDKSISHRALILGALANGRSRIRGVLRSGDLESTAAVLRALGVPVPSLRDEIFLQGGGLRALRRPECDLDCANSGTTARLVAGLVSGQPDVGAARFVGDVGLSTRPMRRVADPLTAMGARIELERGDGLPMVVRGAELRSIDWISPLASAQVKSAILLAGLVSGVRVSVREPILSRDHTERMLAWLGVTIRADGSVTSLAPVGHLAPLDLTVPADPSSAAFLAARAVLADDGELALVDVCLNPTRTGFFRALHDMGAQVELLDESIEAGEPVGAIRARPSELMGIEVSAAEVASMIDELPLLACVASRASGTTRISGAAELRSKESDRIRSVVANLRALGADADERTDGFDVEGSNRPLRGSVRTNGDHRIAMAFGVLAALPGNDITIDDRDCVSISYPGFWRDLRRAARSESRIPTTDYRLPTPEQ